MNPRLSAIQGLSKKLKSSIGEKVKDHGKPVGLSITIATGDAAEALKKKLGGIEEEKPEENELLKRLKGVRDAEKDGN